LTTVKINLELCGKSSITLVSGLIATKVSFESHEMRPCMALLVFRNSLCYIKNISQHDIVYKIGQLLRNLYLVAHAKSFCTCKLLFLRR